MVKRQSIWGYHFGELQNFMKVSVAIPNMVATARRMLEKGIQVGHHGFKSFITYESNMAYVLRYMIDKVGILYVQAHAPSPSYL